MPTPRRDRRANLTALDRATRFIAAYRAGDDYGAALAAQEARADDRLLEFGIAGCIIAIQFAEKAFGTDGTQLNLDGLALDSALFRDLELDRLRGSDDE